MIPQYVPTMKFRDAYAVYRQIMSGWVGPGKRVAELEERVKTDSNRSFAHATTSGTMALWAAVRALEQPRGTVVYFPAYTFLAGAHAALMADHPVALVDINSHTHCMSLGDLDRQIRNHQDNSGGQGRPIVIYVAHNNHYGSDLLRIADYCIGHGYHLIVDGAQCVGNQKVLQMGDISTLSFSVPKLITGGQGGMILTNSTHTSKRITAILDHGAGGWRKSGVHQGPGLNLRMSDVNAALILSQYRRLDKLLAKRAQIWHWYFDQLDSFRAHGGLLGCGWSGSPWMMVYKVDRAHDISIALRERGISAKCRYKATADHEYFDDYGVVCPNAQRAADTLLYLPSSLSLRRRDVNHICDILFEVVRSILS